MTDVVLQSVVQAAMDATSATQGWIVGVAGDGLEVVAATGGAAGDLIGTATPSGSGSAGFVIESGQPLAVAPRGDDPRFGEGVAAILGRVPTSVLSVPCATDEAVLGALELIDKVGGAAFTFDDVELATILATVAGARLGEGDGGGAPIPEPAHLARELERLSSSDPGRYAVVANALNTLLAQ